MPVADPVMHQQPATEELGGLLSSSGERLFSSRPWSSVTLTLRVAPFGRATDLATVPRSIPLLDVRNGFRAVWVYISLNDWGLMPQCFLQVCSFTYFLHDSTFLHDRLVLAGRSGSCTTESDSMSSRNACRASPVGTDEKSSLNWMFSRLSLSRFMSYLPLLSFGPSITVPGSAYLLTPPFGMECGNRSLSGAARAKAAKADPRKAIKA
jgi:hypothetical protein